MLDFTDVDFVKTLAWEGVNPATPLYLFPENADTDLITAIRWQATDMGMITNIRDHYHTFCGLSTCDVGVVRLWEAY